MDTASTDEGLFTKFIFKNDDLIHSSGIFGDEVISILAIIILIIVIFSIFMLMFLKVFVVNNNPTYTEDKFKDMVLNRLNAIDVQKNFQFKPKNSSNISY